MPAATTAGKNRFLLKNKSTKAGILSFQFALTDPQQNQIMEQWTTRSITRIDYK